MTLEFYVNRLVLLPFFSLLFLVIKWSSHFQKIVVEVLLLAILNQPFMKKLWSSKKFLLIFKIYIWMISMTRVGRSVKNEKKTHLKSFVNAPLDGWMGHSIQKGACQSCMVAARGIWNGNKCAEMLLCHCMCCINGIIMCVGSSGNKSMENFEGHIKRWSEAETGDYIDKWPFAAWVIKPAREKGLGHKILDFQSWSLEFQKVKSQ